MKTLNERFSALSMRRRYEVWFLRLGFGDGSGAWWFRYLLMNPGRGVPERTAGAACAGLGNVVSASRKTGDGDPRFSNRESSFERWRFEQRRFEERGLKQNRIEQRGFG